MRYSKFWHCTASWSWTCKGSSYLPEYDVVTWTEYADSFKHFRDKYPYVTIDAFCEAKSDLWTNPDCSRRPWEFETINFIKTDYTNQYLVTKNTFYTGYDVGLDIGFGFKIKNDTLYLRPFYNAWLYKAGMYESYLDYGLAAYSITFHTENSYERITQKRVIQPSVEFVLLNV